MMGADGLKHATETAILSANYISKRLKDHYPTLYASENGHVAHECILDLRGLKETSGVMAEDVAKRLMDYGFHAPTLSFPVPNTLMVEPTESETLQELDRFIDAMIAIRNEVRKVEAGEWPQDNNPLKAAPHTAASLLGAEWNRPYPRELGAFPVASLKAVKYWPPVGRVDNVYGDRNLFCSCLPNIRMRERCPPRLSLRVLRCPRGGRSRLGAARRRLESIKGGTALHAAALARPNLAPQRESLAP
jgi:glycine dehydrogenase